MTAIQTEIADKGKVAAKPAPLFTNGQQCWVKKDNLHQATIVDDYRPSFNAVKVRYDEQEFTVKPEEVLNYNQYMAEKEAREKAKIAKRHQQVVI